MRTPAFSVEVITVPVSDVERWLRFYVDQVGFTLDVDPRPRGGACSNLGSRSVRSGTGRPRAPGTEVWHLASTLCAETAPASPTCSIRTETAEDYSNEATAMCNVVCGSLVISTMRGAVETPRRRPGRIRFSALIFSNPRR